MGQAYMLLGQIGFNERIFRCKMAVERHLVGAGLLGDLVDTDATDAELVEEVTRRTHNAVSRTRAAHAHLCHFHPSRRPFLG